MLFFMFVYVIRMDKNSIDRRRYPAGGLHVLQDGEKVSDVQNCIMDETVASRATIYFKKSILMVAS